VTPDLAEENAAILRGLAARGIDLGRRYEFDFSHIFPSEGEADAFVTAIAHDGFAGRTRHEPDLDLPWDVTVTVPMAADSATVTAMERQLAEIAQLSGGRPDGWGFLDAPLD
jgi:hypothetical protein